MAKAWWEILAEILSSLLTKERLRDAGLTSGESAKGVAVGISLGSGYDREAEEREQRQKIVDFLRSQIGKPYLLGAEVPAGHEADASDWDCSELGESAYRVAGLVMPDGSNYQFDHCRPIAEPKAGDPSFLWSDKWGRIGHVMYYTGDGTLIHAVGGRGVVEDPVAKWEANARFRGWRRHPDFMRPLEERA